MASGEVTIKIILSQTVFGVLGNISLLFHYFFLYFTGHRLRSTDLILQHVLVANSLVLLCRGVPQTTVAFGLTDFLNDLGCKFVFYLHRLGRGVPMDSTCLLSVFQAITTSPQHSRWAELKMKSHRYLGSCILLCWVLQVLLNLNTSVYVTGKSNDINITLQKDLGFCSADHADPPTLSLYATLLLFPDVTSLSLMLWSSGSMIFILYRHKRQVQYMHRTNVSLRSSLESRATRRILFLVSTFVSRYTLSSVFQICIDQISKPSWLLLNIAALVCVCFPAACPFMLTSDNFPVYRLCAWARNVKSPDLNSDV